MSPNQLFIVAIVLALVGPAVSLVLGIISGSVTILLAIIADRRAKEIKQAAQKAYEEANHSKETVLQLRTELLKVLRVEERREDLK